MGMEGRMRGKRCLRVPVSQTCAFILASSTVTMRVANSTPIVDLLSGLNSLRTNRDSTVATR